MLQYPAIHCNTLQYTTIHCNTLQYTETLQHTTTHCSALQHTTTHCTTCLTWLIYVYREHRKSQRSIKIDTPQHTATHHHTPPHTATHRHTLPHTATHCHTLQHSATHCSKATAPPHTAHHMFENATNLQFQVCQANPSFYRAVKIHRMLQVAGLFPQKEPLIKGLFCRKWPIKIRHPRHPCLRHPVLCFRVLDHRHVFSSLGLWLIPLLVMTHLSRVATVTRSFLSHDSFILSIELGGSNLEFIRV